MKFEEVYFVFKLSSDKKATAVNVDYVGELIRCRDCKWFDRVDSEMGWCNGFGDGHGVPYEGYCYSAERKENEDN